MTMLKQANACHDVPLWGRWEGVYRTTSDLPPEAEVAVELTAPSGRLRHQPGFWDGMQTWRIRFMPDEVGTWRYRLSVNGELDPSAEGRFACRRVAGGSALLTHGPVRISDDRHSLVHADGTPFFLLSDTAWNGPLHARPADWQAYLADRQAKLFNAIQFVTHAPWQAAYSDAEGQVSFTCYEPLPVNPAAFRRIDAAVDALNAAGMVALPVLLWAIRPPFSIGAVIPEDMLIRMARYQVARYGGHHVMWILAGDAKYEGEVAEKWKRIGRAVFGDADRAPVFMHPGGLQNPYDTLRDEPWLDLVGYQSGHLGSEKAWHWLHSGTIASEWKQQPTRPVINLEPPYEAHARRARDQAGVFDDTLVRRASWWSMLNAPPAGLSYGAHGIWSWETAPREPLNHPGTEVAQPWHEALKLPGSVQMRHLAAFFTALPWWRLRPADLLAEEPAPADAAGKALAAAADDGSLAVVYLPVGGVVRLQAERLAADLRAHWYDPRTGQWQPAESTAGQGGYRTPDRQDWALLLQAGEAVASAD